MSEDLSKSFQDPDNSCITSWHDLVQNLSTSHLEVLENIFKSKDSEVSKEEFFNSLHEIFDKYNCPQQIITLYDLINKNNSIKIKWSEFLEFLLENLALPTDSLPSFQIAKIITIPQTRREAIVKIVLIETEKYFCYAVVSKHGRIGLYDGNLNFLTTYQLIMTREDIYRKEEDRRKRNRWVTDAIFCTDTLMFVVTNTARSIVIYEASGLKHVPLWLILSTPNIVECLAYRSSSADQNGESTLFTGDDSGKILSFIFLQPKTLLLRKRHNDKINLFYWDELPEEKEFVIIKRISKPDQSSINRLVYSEDTEALISCSGDSKASLIIKYMRNKSPVHIFSMPKGCNCFALSRERKVLICGSKDGSIRLWNPLVTMKPVAILTGHQTTIVDVKIMDKENLFMSCSRDGTFKVWSIKDQKCIHTFTISFPSFSVFGRLIEWGSECIYPGPKRSFENTQEINIWERSPILVTCCNHIALIKIISPEKLRENCSEKQILPPPPLQNSVLIPKMWKTSDHVELIRNDEAHQKTMDTTILEQRLKELDFILKKDLFADNGFTNSDVNFKIATLERKKIFMKQHVARGAPYLALDLHEVNDLRLSPGLPVPNKKKVKNIVEKIEKVLQDASSRDLIFSEPSSSRSPRSSRSSFVEFD